MRRSGAGGGRDESRVTGGTGVCGGLGVDGRGAFFADETDSHGRWTGRREQQCRRHAARAQRSRRASAFGGEAGGDRGAVGVGLRAVFEGRAGGHARAGRAGGAASGRSGGTSERPARADFQTPDLHQHGLGLPPNGGGRAAVLSAVRRSGTASGRLAGDEGGAGGGTAV